MFSALFFVFPAAAIWAAAVLAVRALASAATVRLALFASVRPHEGSRKRKRDEGNGNDDDHDFAPIHHLPLSLPPARRFCFVLST